MTDDSTQANVDNLDQTPDGAGSIAEPKFTQEQLDKIIAKRIKEVKSQFADYDDLQAKVKAMQDEQLTEVEKARKAAEEYKAALEQAETRAKQTERRALRLQIASELGLNPTLANRLVGDDEQSIRDDAKALLSLMGTSTPPPPKTDASAATGQRPPKSDTVHLTEADQQVLATMPERLRERFIERRKQEMTRKRLGE